MAKTDALSIVLSNDTADKLMERYAELVDFIKKNAISEQLKNTNLSGDQSAGSVVARRMETSVVKARGTARTAGAGDVLKNNGVEVNLDQHKEIVEEVAQLDIDLYGVDGIVAKRQANHQASMMVALDTAFFACAEAVVAGETDLSAYDTVVAKVEALIQSIETTVNTNVNGVDRAMINVTLTPQYFGELENYIDTLPNVNGVSIDLFHRVRVFSNTRQTKDAIAMVTGAIAQPVNARPYSAQQIPLSDDIAIMLFFDYGTKAVMPDLIKWATLSDEVSA